MNAMGGLASVRETYELLRQHHYLGPTKAAGFAWVDEYGCIVFAAPRARGVPHRWLEVVRWCLVAKEPNAGSRQWARAAALIRRQRPDCTTILSYSDPSQGHNGALYRACNWIWAPTWHRLRPPPSGNGNWGAGQQAVKDRWVFPLLPDEDRQLALSVKDDALRRKYPWAEYAEPAWRRGRFDNRERAGAWKRFKEVTS